MYEHLTGKKTFVNIIPPSKDIKEKIQHYYGQRLYIFPVLQHFTHIYIVTQLNMVKIKENYKSINNIFVTSYIEVSLLTY